MSAELRSRRNVFAGLALDRCSESRPDRDWIDHALNCPAHASSSSIRGKALLTRMRSICANGSCRKCHWLAAICPYPARLRRNQIAHFLLAADAPGAQRLAEAAGGQFMDLRSAGLVLSAFEAGMFAYARGLAHWQARTRWCSACGSALVLEWAGHRGRCSSPDCAIEHYPRTDPAIIVIVTWRDACLLGRQAAWPKGRFSTLAGFVEPGETLECRRSEVFEETGRTSGRQRLTYSHRGRFVSLMLGSRACRRYEHKVGDENE